LFSGFGRDQVNPFDLTGNHQASGRSDHLAFRWLGRCGEVRDFTYAQLDQAAETWAAMLQRLGIRPGDVVAVMTGRRPETVVAALGIWKAGGVYCPLFRDLGPDLLQARLILGKVRWLIAAGEAFDDVIGPVRDKVAGLQGVLLTGPAPVAGTLHLEDELRATPQAGSFSRPDGPGGMLHFTSGSTAPLVAGLGQPKAVIHAGEVVNFIANTTGQVFALTPQDLMWCMAEPGWVTHTAYGLIAPLVCGASLLMDEGACRPPRCLAVLEDHPITVWYSSPAVIRGLMGGGVALARRYRPRALRLAASVGEPLSADAAQWGADVLGVPFRDSWWQTETGGIVLGHGPSEPPRPGCMGRPLRGMEVALAQRPEDGGAVILAGSGSAIGELAVKVSCLAPWQSLGGEPGALAEVVDGWHLTGDRVRRDEDGYYSFLGRKDEVIKTGGRTIGPFEVERALLGHPAVAEVGVVGQPDLSLNERIVAFVAVNPGFQPGPLLREELRAYAGKHLGAALAPHDIEFTQDLPRTPNGKIIRRYLRERLAVSKHSQSATASVRW